ncbi:MAG TPA: hypothetical protein VFE47_12215 [Tepidisphaeraceae bacterium]|nr:hypothetical protein [Tepidisphaeraceae bacterium]
MMDMPSSKLISTSFPVWVVHATASRVLRERYFITVVPVKSKAEITMIVDQTRRSINRFYQAAVYL